MYTEAGTLICGTCVGLGAASYTYPLSLIRLFSTSIEFLEIFGDESELLDSSRLFNGKRTART